jgi:hypothetical protein
MVDDQKGTRCHHQDEADQSQALYPDGRRQEPTTVVVTLVDINVVLVVVGMVRLGVR